MTRAETVARMSEVERNTSLTELLLSVGLHHSPKDGYSREIRKATGEVVGVFSYDEALALFVEMRDGRSKLPDFTHLPYNEWAELQAAHYSATDA